MFDDCRNNVIYYRDSSRISGVGRHNVYILFVVVMAQEGV